MLHMKMITLFSEVFHSTSFTNKEKHDYSVLLAHGAASLAGWFPSFQESVILLSASDENFQLFGHYQPRESASQSRRKKISIAPPLNLENSQEADVITNSDMSVT
jgi:hypothetical protein